MASIEGALIQLKWPSVIIVFDAGSTDGSLEFLKEKVAAGSAVGRPLLNLLSPEPGRTSFSAGVNQAADFALSRFPEVEYLLLFETDNLLLNPDALAKAICLLNHKLEVGACGFSVEKRNGQKTAFGCQKPGLLHMVLGNHLSYLFGILKSEVRQWQRYRDFLWREADIVFTSPMVIRAKTWRVVKGMEEGVFPYSDCDIDLCIRIHKAGWKIAVVDCHGVVHDNGGSPSRWFIHRVAEREFARFRFSRKFFQEPGFLGFLLVFMRQLFELFLAILLFSTYQKPFTVFRSRWNVARKTIPFLVGLRKPELGNLLGD